MVVLHGSGRSILLFGRGLIGSAIEEALHRRGFDRRLLSFDWQDPARRENDWESILEGLDGESVSVIWSAGAAGFDCDASSAEQELANFTDVLQRAETLAHQADRFRFLMISSAGGLFEGRTGVQHQSTPTPLRPYGDLKLAQEDRLASSSIPDWRIIRPASVFGYVRAGVRCGLIPTVLKNGLSGRVTPIFGGFSTLRDYVWAGDLGRRVATLVLEPDVQRSREIFASGIPTSLLQIKTMAERLLRRRIYVACSALPTNARPMAFHPACWPDGQPRHRLMDRMARVYQDLLIQGGWAA